MTVTYCSKQADFTHCGFHNHKNWEVIVRLKGHTRSTVGQLDCSVSENDIVVIPPGVLHADVCDGPCTDISFSVDVMDFSGILHLHDHSGNVRVLAELLYQVFLEKENNYQNIVDALAQSINEHIKKISALSAQTPFVCQLKDTLFQNIGNPYFDLSGEIEKTGFHPDYVRRCFKAETGCAPLAYLTRLRLSKAKHLLLQAPHETIYNIAPQCGFQDASKSTPVFPLSNIAKSIPKVKNSRPLAGRLFIITAQYRA